MANYPQQAPAPFIQQEGAQVDFDLLEHSTFWGGPTASRAGRVHADHAVEMPLRWTPAAAADLGYVASSRRSKSTWAPSCWIPSHASQVRTVESVAPKVLVSPHHLVVLERISACQL